MPVAPQIGAILGPDGVVARLPVETLTFDEVQLLRSYKRFLSRHGYREALYCNRCFEGQLSDGCEAHVTPNDILIRCRCRMTIDHGAETT